MVMVIVCLILGYLAGIIITRIGFTLFIRRIASRHFTSQDAFDRDVLSGMWPVFLPILFVTSFYSLTVGRIEHWLEK